MSYYFKHHIMAEQSKKKVINIAAYKQEVGRTVVCLTNSDFPLSEKSMHFVDICHELDVTKGEIGHISSRLSSCQHLEQSWRRKQLC